MDEFVFVDRSDDVVENFGPEEMKFEEDSDCEVLQLGCPQIIGSSENTNKYIVFDNVSEDFGHEEMIFKDDSDSEVKLLGPKLTCEVGVRRKTEAQRQSDRKIPYVFNYPRCCPNPPWPREWNFFSL